MNNIKGYQSKILKYLFDNKYYKEELLKNIKIIVLSSWEKIIFEEDLKKSLDILIHIPIDIANEKKEIEIFINYFMDYLEKDTFVSNILLEEYYKNKEKIIKYLQKNIKIVKN